MHVPLIASDQRRPVWFVTGALASLGVLGLVTGAIYLLEPVAPILSLGVLYLFAVLPVAAIWGLPFALPVSLVSMLAFNFLFLPPKHTFRLTESENWVALAVYLVTAVSVSALAARARRRAAEAEQQRREATLAAEVSADLLESRDVEQQLPAIAARVARLLGAAGGRIELAESPLDPEDSPRGSLFDLSAGDRRVGRLVLDFTTRPDGDIAARILPVIASLLATAIEREQLAHDAHESEARRQQEAIEAESLRRSDAAKTAVLRSVSHDLRSPITAIMAASDVLERSGDSLSHSERHELLASIRLQVIRLERFVSNLLDLSRLEAGAARPMPELWTVDGLVARALETIGTENERIDVVLPPDSPPVRVDPSQLEHVLVNILENALKFSSSTERVTVCAEGEGDELVIRVIDRGVGIPLQERERIFEPFVRGANGSQGGGSGLGLTIARGFVDLNGGRLWVETGSGIGAVFAVALPLAALPAEAPA